jgi:hypothetical protein
LTSGDGHYYSLNNRRLYVLKYLRDNGHLEPLNTIRVRVKAPLPREIKKYSPAANYSLTATLMKERPAGKAGEEGGGAADGEGEGEDDYNTNMDEGEGKEEVKGEAHLTPLAVEGEAVACAHGDADKGTTGGRPDDIIQAVGDITLTDTDTDNKDRGTSGSNTK